MNRIRELDFPLIPVGGILVLGMTEMGHEEERASNDPVRFRTGEAWDAIKNEFQSSGQAPGAQIRLTAEIDGWLAGSFNQLVEPALPHAAALVALGELGRSGPFPFSAVEVAIITGAEASSPGFSQAVAEWVRALWDSGLRVSCTVRSVAECAAYQAATADFTIGLLDMRHVAGDAAVCERLSSRLREVVARRRDALLTRLLETTRERHARYRNTVRHAEPDLKDGPGGLRDLETIGLLAKVRSDYQFPREPLQDAAAFLASGRFALHYHSSQDYNTAAAEVWAGAGIGSLSRGAWLAQYFVRARDVFNETRRALDESVKRGDSLLDRFRDRRSQLSNAEFTVSRDRVFLRNPARLAGDPGIALRLAGFVARHGAAPSGETERRLEAVAGTVAEHWRREPPDWPAMRSMLASPHASAALRALDAAGLLAALLPEWEAASDRVEESAPGFTAGERALQAVERFEMLRSSTGDSNRAFRELAIEIDEPAVLILALLLREAAAPERAGKAAVRLQMPKDRAADLAFLIERQPEFPAVLVGRDVDNPTTARLLADLAGTTERLKLLAALTWADTAAGADSSASWRLDQLWTAYSRGRRELTLELETDRIREAPALAQGRAEFIEGFPTRYLRTRSGEIDAHLRLYAESRPTGVAVSLERLEGAHRLTVIARDVPRLFASLAGAISSFGLNILKAEAFSNSRGVVLDTFVFADTKRTLELNPQEAERLQDLLRRVALGKTEARRLLREPERPGRKRAPHARVRFDAEACETATLVEIETDDRPGLLFGLATAFSAAGCNIDVVLIDTQASRAIDVFYVAHEGHKLTADFQARLEEKLLGAC